MAQEDEAIGRNLRAIREGLGWSQAKVAEEMTRRGVAGFYPQTVTKLEAGSRSLKMHEGVHLAEILGTSPQALVQASPDEVVQAELRTAVAWVKKGLLAAQGTVVELLLRSKHLAELIEQATPEQLEAVGTDVTDRRFLSPEELAQAIVRGAIDRYGDMTSGGHQPDREVGEDGKPN